MHHSIRCASLLVLAPTVVLAHATDDVSIPEPTKLSVVASAVTARMNVLGNSAPITSSESTAEIAVVELISVDDLHQLGLRVAFQTDGQVDTVYLDASEASQLRNEFADFESWHDRGKPCEAVKQCVHGIARCRPTQDVRQAICPGLYSTPDGERGVIVSTARHSFRFPATRPATFVSAIDNAIDGLDL